MDGHVVDGALVRLRTADTAQRASKRDTPSATGRTEVLALPRVGMTAKRGGTRAPGQVLTGNEPHLLQVEFRDRDRRQYMRVRIPSLPGACGAEKTESYVSQQPILPIEVVGGTWGHLSDPLKRFVLVFGGMNSLCSACRRLDVRPQLQSFVRWRPEGHALDISPTEDMNIEFGDPCRGARKVCMCATVVSKVHVIHAVGAANSVYDIGAVWKF